MGLLVIQVYVHREPEHGTDGINIICHSLSMLGKLGTVIKFISVHWYSHL